MNRISREISLTEGMMTALQDADDIKQENFIQELEASGVFYSLLLDYEYGKGNLQHVKPIVDSLVLTSPSDGFLLVGYDINEFSLCAAIDYTAGFTMKLDFKIDRDQRKITFTGEERYERQDEF